MKWPLFTKKSPKSISESLPAFEDTIDDDALQRIDFTYDQRRSQTWDIVKTYMGARIKHLHKELELCDSHDKSQKIRGSIQELRLMAKKAEFQKPEKPSPTLVRGAY